MDAPPILFESKSVKVELTDHTLPAPPIQWGGRLRQTVTRYSDDWVTVQSHGVELTSITLQGELRDSGLGKGKAQAVRAQLTQLMTAREVVAFSYDREQFWGVFEVEFEEAHRGAIVYRVKFIPLWTQDPVTIIPPAIEEKPRQKANRMDRIAKQLSEQNTTTPSAIPPDAGLLSKQAILGVLTASAVLTGALRKMQNFKTLSFVELTLLESTVWESTKAARTLTALMKKGVELTGASADEAVDILRWQYGVIDSARGMAYEVFQIAEQLRSVRAPLMSRQYVVKDGDTLHVIAGRLLGDFTQWVKIMELNNLHSPHVEPGDVLMLPSFGNEAKL